jgi:hypothetical protein
MPNLELKESRTARRWVLVIWPAFLTACILEALVFSMVDPGEVHWPGQVTQAARQGVYTVAFFCFWLVSAACSCLVLWLEEGGKAVNDTAAVD